MDNIINISVENLNEMKSFAKKLTKLFKPPILVCLKGEIGTGKTTLARFIINEISERKVKVLSPTFPIVQIYEVGEIKIWHYDLYRVKHRNEFFNLDFELAFSDCVIVEWPDIFFEFFPPNRTEISFKEQDINKRLITVNFLGNTQKFKKVLWM